MARHSAGGNLLLDARQRVGQPGAADHQIADVAHQLVEAREIDADEMRRRHAPPGKAPTFDGTLASGDSA